MPDISYTAPEFVTSVVNIATDSTTVTAKRAMIRGIYVNTVLSAHACLILDGATTTFTLPASLAAGTWVPFGDAVFNGGIVVDPDNSGTGNITVVYKVIT